MATYVDLDGVRTWYEEYGTGRPLVLLHPGGYGAAAFEVNIGPLAEHFHIYTPERRGHGNTPDVAGRYTFEQGAQDTIAFF
ncbi:alpha/beta fold hydrolase [Fodinicola feengrottensis]|uniref:alpha/beta fold hydrolase n=1 Tax=Fodinicola feengrottensis TaxID=435914 RepID=UPI002442BC15|nr:alpha/beta hydrolase [Fodinicola feengrottensis]